MKSTVQERFDVKHCPEPNTGCWIWFGSLNRIDGYGQLRINGVMTLAHRVSYELHVGSIPNDMSVLHKCDVPCCVNPEHLFIGTRQDNMDDMVRKGRQFTPKGSAHGNSKLTEVLAIEIFHAKGTERGLAAIYGVGQRVIGQIKRKQAWKHIHECA